MRNDNKLHYTKINSARHLFRYVTLYQPRGLIWVQQNDDGFPNECKNEGEFRRISITQTGTKLKEQPIEMDCPFLTTLKNLPYSSSLLKHHHKM